MTLQRADTAHPIGDPNQAQQYKEVRGLSRGIALLKALNRMPGGISSTSELARRCDIHRTTAKRLLETLRMEGLIEVGEKDGQYRLAQGIRLLSDGFADEDWITQVVVPALRDAAGHLVWPCNLATLDAGQMVIRESTRRFSPLSRQHALIGERLPLLHSSLGRAYLAACDADELQAIMTDLKKQALPLKINVEDLKSIESVIAQTRERGYALNEGLNGAKFTSVAVPVVGGTRLLGAINLVFTRDSQSKALIEDKYVVALKTLADRIGVSSKSWIDA